MDSVCSEVNYFRGTVWLRGPEERDTQLMQLGHRSPGHFNCHHSCSHRILPGSVPMKKIERDLQIEHPSNTDELCLCDPVHSKNKSGSNTGLVVHERKDLLRFGAI